MEASANPTEKPGLRWLLRRSGPARRWTALSIALGLGGGLLLVAQASLLANIIQGVFIDRLPRELLLPLFGLLAAVILVRAILSWGREIAGYTAGARVREQVRTAILEKIVELGPAYTGRMRTGALASTALEQVESLQAFFAHYLPQLALAVMIPAAILCFVLPLSWAAGGLLLLSAPLIPLFMVLVGMGAESISQKNFQALSRLSAHFLDVLQGFPTLKVFGRSRREAESVAQASAGYRRETLRVLRVAFLSSAVLEFFSSMAIALVAVYLGMRYLGYLNFGDWGRPLNLSAGFFILLLAPDFFLPLRELGTHYHARAEAVGAAEEIVKVLSETPGSAAGRRPLLRPPDRIRFEEVHFGYGGGRGRVLDGVDLTLEAGNQVALVGASGAGKTTVLQLMMGFVQPTGGRIVVDGQSLTVIDPRHWRRYLAWIGQAPILFHGTIRENIRIGRPDADENALESAARLARVLEFSRELPAGLDTVLGEQGMGLSRGQAQRVALARAFVKDAPILLMDEPTAGLDVTNERMILEALKDFVRGRTVLMVTHRLENLQRADRVLVLQNGRIVEEGSYSKLLQPGRALHREVDTEASRG